jgi:hypothetical protein
MFLIRCPITGTDELVSESSVVAVTNHPTHIAMTVEHVYRTGRRWESRQAKELVGA